MQTVEVYDAATPEDIVVSVNLAGIGSRATAAMIDVLIQLGMIWVVSMVISIIAAMVAVGSTDAAAVIAAVDIIAAFLVLFGYHVVFEYYWRGRTPGKAALRIHVARDGGLPLTISAVLIRNVLRIVDFLPLFYVVGLVVLSSNSRRKRIGDFLGGTVVVKNDVSEPGTGYIIVNPRPYEAYAWWDTSGVTDEEELLVRRFLDRRRSLTPAARYSLGEDLAARLRPKVLGADPGLPSEWFLENVALATSERHSRATWEHLRSQHEIRSLQQQQLQQQQNPLGFNTPLPLR